MISASSVQVCFVPAGSVWGQTGPAGHISLILDGASPDF